MWARLRPSLTPGLPSGLNNGSNARYNGPAGRVAARGHEEAPVSDPIKTRLDRRREELGRRAAMIKAAGELNEPGGEIAFAALMDEMRYLRELEPAH